MNSGVMADGIPRYQQPMDPMEVEDERETCDRCMHCHIFTDCECRMLMGKMTPYGSWDRRRMLKEVTHALKCHGKCEVTGDMVDLEQGACEHWEVAE